MNVCVIGHFNEDIQEGVRNVTKELVKTLEKKGISVLPVMISKILPWKKIQDFHPDIIHFVITPTIGGLLIAKITAYFCNDAKIVVSAIHNSIDKRYSFLRYLAPDLIFVQSKESEMFYKSLNFSVEVLPNGVDIEKFKHCSVDEKIQFRKQMNFKEDDFILLHLASFTSQRNLSIFKEILIREPCEVLIIGREHEKVDQDLINELENAGCRIEIKNFPRIEEIFQLADCYVFPTIDRRACIETPLSVLEAMSCNLPVISTRFGALPSIFEKKIDGLFFIEHEDDYVRFIKIIKEKKFISTTREQVLKLSWENVSDRMVEKYKDLIQSS